MRLITFLISVNLLTVSAATFSQTEIISIRAENQSVKELLHDIELQTGMMFLYQAELINELGTVTITENEITVKDFLNKLFHEQTIQVLFLDEKLIILTDKQNSLQQRFTVEGSVYDGTSGESLPGVNIVIKEMNRGTVTDHNGKFAISVSDTSAILVFSFVGYETKEFRVGNRTEINVAMIPETSELDEVVVIGYGTMAKSDLTGSIAVVDMDIMSKQHSLTASQALQGLAPGVSVISSGDPGGSPIIQIRGVSSLTNNNPLFVIDGVPVTDAREYNPSDIESVQVLKDASAAAIYGSRAANGVVIITTKKGRTKKLDIQFNSRVGTSYPAKLLDLADAQEYAALDNMARDNANMPRNPVSELAISDPLMVPDTDWQSEFFRQGLNQNYDLSLSGYSENTSYYLAGGYYNSKGTVIETDFERYSMTMNLQHDYEKFTFGENIRLARTSSSDIVHAMGSESGFIELVRMVPTIPVYNEDNVGGYGYGTAENLTYATNPIGLQELYAHGTDLSKILGNIFGEYSFTDHLKYKVLFGLDHHGSNYRQFHKSGRLRYGSEIMPSSLSENRQEYSKIVINNMLTYDRKFEDLKLNVLLGTAYENEHFSNTVGYGENLTQNPSNNSYNIVLDATTSNQEAYGGKWETLLMSYFSRLNVSYKDRYLFTTTIRADGSSKFASMYRWGFFPSASAAWKLHNEAFMEEVEVISTLKVKAGYGSLGGQEVGAYDYLGYVSTNLNYILGGDQSVQTGSSQTRFSNESLTWQTVTTKNVGLDVGLFNNKMFLMMEYYSSLTEQALVPVDVPASIGNYGGNPPSNVGSFKNNGFEMSLSLGDKVGDFKYNLTTTFSTLENKVLSLGNSDGIVDWLGKTAVGFPIASFFLLETDGIFQSQEEIDAHQNSEGVIIQPDARPGFVRYIDYNDDGMINNDDRQMIGTPFPKYEAGLNLSLQYKNIDFRVFLFGAAGHQIFNVPRYWLERNDDVGANNYPSGYDPWTEENPSNTTPIAIAGDAGASNNIINADRWLEKGNYIKIKTLEIGYTIPGTVFRKMNILDGSLRLYFSADNFLTFTRYTGLDPEMVNAYIWHRGMDWGAYPNSRSYVFGLQLNL
ncbi:MAG: TonB-dependent receptor [Bacteroidales bacterium]|nr:TonB-dependent receptor [Bacteroidales bacterium]